MSSAHQNLSETAKTTNISASGMNIGIVVADWNKHITHTLLEGAKSTILEKGGSENEITVLHVPGTFELPFGAKQLLQSGKCDGVICLGCVIKGETKHDEYINMSVANGIQQLSLISNRPVIFGVLTPNTEEQAIDRAGGKHGNKGVEAADTVITMIELQKQFKISKKGIGF